MFVLSIDNVLYLKCIHYTCSSLVSSYQGLIYVALGRFRGRFLSFLTIIQKIHFLHTLRTCSLHKINSLCNVRLPKTLEASCH